ANSNTMSEGAHVGNTVNGNNNYISGGDYTSVTFNGNSTTEVTAKNASMWFYGAINSGYCGTNSWMDLYGSSNYESSSNGSIVRNNNVYASNHGWIGPVGEYIQNFMNSGTYYTSSTGSSGMSF